MGMIEELDANGTQAIGSGIAFAVTSTVAVILRLVTGSLTEKRYGADDTFIIIALFGLYGHVAVAIWGTISGGSGEIDTPNFNFHVDHSMDHTMIYLQASYIVSALYAFTSFACKLSILLFYKRIFDVPVFRMQTLVLEVITIMYFITCEFTVVLSCTPLTSLWDPKPGTVCINFDTFFLAITIIEMFLDTAILILPIRIILTLQLSVRNRIQISSIFLLGGFIIVTNIVRIHFTFIPGGSVVNITRIDLWNHIHMGCSILCACLPTYRPMALVKKISSLIADFQDRHVGLCGISRSRKHKTCTGTGATAESYNELADPPIESLHSNEIAKVRLYREDCGYPLHSIAV